ncbi:MAG: hemolysin III family protein [Planctomycetota bacterium]
MDPRGIIPYLAFTEPFSSLSHFGGALALLLLAARLFGHVRGCPRRTRAIALYLLGVGGMFLASGTYHFLEHGSLAHRVFWHLDHAMIWAAIVTTISAVQVLAGVGTRRAIRAVWLLGAAGVIAEQFVLRGLAPWISPLLYIAMGWVGLFPFLRLIRLHGFRFAAPLAWAGLFSTLGGACDALEWPMLVPGVVEGHEVMHLLIVAGMGCFAWAVDRCARLTPRDTALLRGEFETPPAVAA